MVTANTKHALLEEEDLNDDNTINVFVPTPSSKRRKRAEVESSNSDEAKVVTPSPKKRKVLPVRTKDGDDELLSNSRPVVEVPARKMTPEAESVVAQPSSKKTHRRFDSEEHTEEFFSTAREQAVVEDEEHESAEEEEDSDDDAPEAIGMQEAAQTIKSREQDTAKAVKEQKESSRQKRKERDEALRKQSEAAKKRRPRARKEKVVVTIESDSDEQGAMDEAEDDVEPSTLPYNRAPPNLLPLEFLEDDDPNEVIPVQETTQRVSKKHKFKDLSEKAPKDKRIGGTTYRVTKKQSTNLAPKAAHNARSVKESWLQGRSGTKIDPSRKAFSKGFFKK